MDKKLKVLLDYQHFSGNKRLDAVIEKTLKGAAKELSFDELDFVNAAGNPFEDDKKNENREIR